MQVKIGGLRRTLPAVILVMTLPIQDTHHQTASDECLESKILFQKLQRVDCGSACSSHSKSSVWTRKQWTLLFVLLTSTVFSSFAVCLFPPFFPKLAEEKGFSATVYGLIIGTNCFVSFIVTPFVGKYLKTIGTRFAFTGGTLVAGLCCLLSGFLQYFPTGGLAFPVIAVCIRAVHAIGSAGVIVSTFTYMATEFPDSVAKIFAISRATINIGQLAGLVLGGALIEMWDFKMPFIVVGVLNALFAFIVLPLLPNSDDKISEEDSDKSSKKVTLFQILSIPTIWFSFLSFIIATMCNGFISINLEPQVLRKFNMSPFYVGFLFGLKDGANSIASPIWGCLCDKRKNQSLKPFIIASSLMVGISFFLLAPFPGLPLRQTLGIVIAALTLNGIGIGGQQVAGVADALREAVSAGYVDDTTTHGLIAGLWSSFSGAGRFISRAGSGVLVDHIGFQYTALIPMTLQAIVSCITILYVFSWELWKPKQKQDVQCNTTPNYNVVIIESGQHQSITVTDTCSPSESVTTKSVSLHHHCKPPLPSNHEKETPPLYNSLQ